MFNQKEPKDDIGFKRLFTIFKQQSKGAAVIEYVVVLCLIAFISAPLFPQLRDVLKTQFDESIGNISAAINGGAFGPPSEAPIIPPTEETEDPPVIEAPTILTASIEMNGGVSLDPSTPVSFKARGSGGTGPYSFVWSGDYVGKPDGTAGEPRSYHQGNYQATVTITDSEGKTATDTIDFTVGQGYFVYEVGGGKAVITDYIGDSFGITNVRIPTELGGAEVDRIGVGAFKAKGLTEVYIPDTVVEIGEGSFYGNELTKARLSENVTTIPTEAFGNNKLTDFQIPDGVQVIDYAAFENNLLTGITLPNSLEQIGASAFARNKLESVIIPNSVSEIGTESFTRNELASVVISNNLAEIPARAFSYNKLTSVAIPQSVHSIWTEPLPRMNWRRFSREGLVHIGESAFKNNKIASLKLPDSARIIDARAFSSNDIKNLDLNEGLAEIRYDAFFDNLIDGVVLPNSLTYLGDWAFDRNQITYVVISSQLEKIPYGAFYDNFLVSVTIPGTVKTVGEWAFESNEILAVELQEGIQVIEERAFRWNQIESLVIPQSGTAIRAEAFYTNQLREVEVKNRNATIENNAFEGQPHNTVFKGPSESAIILYAKFHGRPFVSTD